MKAARMMLEEIAEHARRGDDFAFESTLAGRTYVRMIRQWREDGYPVELIFLALASPEEALARVAARVAQGGHLVPDEAVRRRFFVGLDNFQTIYRPEVTVWWKYDNSGYEPKLIAQGTNP